MDIGGEYYEGDVRGMVSDMCAIVQNYFELVQQEKKRRRQLEKKRQQRKLARMEMVESHEGNKQKRRPFSNAAIRDQLTEKFNNQ
jgi:hypothetical protein